MFFDEKISFYYCPICGSLDLAYIREPDYFLCKNCGWNGEMPKDNPDIIQEIANAYKRLQSAEEKNSNI